MNYQVKLDTFEGPFDLLLTLITKQKIDVCDISLTAVIEDYLEYLHKMKRFDLEVASEFMVIAATLLHIKAGSLLAEDQEEEFEELSPEEARELLVARLIEYKKYKNAAAYFHKLADSHFGFCRRIGEFEKYTLARTDFTKVLSGEKLALTLVPVLLKYEEPVVISTDHILVPPVDLKDKIDFVSRKLRVNKTETFWNLTKHCCTKMEAAVTFLALLELYRRRIIELEQIEAFGDIIIKLLREDEEWLADQIQTEGTAKDIYR